MPARAATRYAPAPPRRAPGPVFGPPEQAGDRAALRRFIRSGSRSFATAALLLPPRLRADSFALYAFCRVSDDLIDDAGGGEAAIADLRRRLARIYDGRPDDRVADRAFAAAVRRHQLPHDLPAALLDGLAWDVRGVRCEDIGELHRYAAHVAASVGAMMALMMGVRDPDMLARACDLGVAMQLTNIARDVGEDARAGRLYLPRQWLREAGIDAERFLQAPVFDAALGQVVARLLRHADALYQRAEPALLRLPRPCRPGMLAAARIYRAIGTQVAAQGHDSVSARARVKGGRKFALAAAAALRTLGGASTWQDELRAPPLPQTAFLLHAIARPLPQRRHLSDRLIWAASLLARRDLPGSGLAGTA